MTRTVVAIYDDFEAANVAVRELVDMGIPRDNISIIANNTRGQYGYQGTSETAQAGTDKAADETGAGAGVGAGIGAAIGGIGGLLVGLGALVIPGIGPVIAAGPLAVALSTLTGAGVGAVAGGVTGGLLGALIGLGIPEEEAEYYAEGVRRGGVLVTVQAEDHNTNKIMDMLNRHSPVDINERATQWREQGWTRFDPKAESVHTPSSASMPADTDEFVERRSDLQSKPGFGDFDIDNPRYRSHYETYLANTGYPYDYYAPAYQFGYGLLSNELYKNSTWDVIEPDVRTQWEKDHPGTWDRFMASIRYAWQDLTGDTGDRREMR